ncbi:MFS transporter [Mangrovibacter plantisponsor]|uniref:Fucose permease n=1 Tax=Mangrovibacter plantisponsor TaxID=451513 RepID=A0A317PWK2_9ENTR|nr:MFS transporter [Mangrovibacter plantisponsor]PWW07094.1 fucose permease [Mangrovibacter plantisponsor]
MNEKISTRIIFFIAGLVTATWAVLVPYAKSNTNINDASLGTLLLCLGLGAMIAMPVTGALTSRYGCRKVITAAVLVIIISVPFLSFLSSPLLLGAGLLIFGISIGITDCAMNVQAILVEKSADKSLMSGFHGMYSVGGIAGAGAMTGLLHLGLTAITSTIIMCVAVFLLLMISVHKLLPYANPAEGPAFAVPKGIVLVLGLICFIIFMAEGTVLDWSAVYLVEKINISESLGGLGFAAFAAAMTAGRLSGDYVIEKLGAFKVVLSGTAVAILGFILVIHSIEFTLILIGYSLIGAGCSNIVPVMFSQIGKQSTMPQMVAVPAVTTLGYIGVLAGPAIIGYISHHSSITYGFVFITTLILCAAILSYAIKNILRATPQV